MCYSEIKTEEVSMLKNPAFFFCLTEVMYKKQNKLTTSFSLHFFKHILALFANAYGCTFNLPVRIIPLTAVTCLNTFTEYLC